MLNRSSSAAAPNELLDRAPPSMRQRDSQTGDKTHDWLFGEDFPIQKAWSDLSPLYNVSAISWQESALSATFGDGGESRHATGLSSVEVRNLNFGWCAVVFFLFSKGNGCKMILTFCDLFCLLRRPHSKPAPGVNFPVESMRLSDHRILM